jgi:protein-tyrosine phosphatase
MDVSCWLDVEGCFNVRDAGGWSAADGRRMRTGLLYRADEPARMTPRGRAVIDGLGLRTVIDLRSQAQFDRGHLFADPALTHHVPVVDRVIAADDPRRLEEAADIARLYDEMVELRRENVIRAVEVVATNIGDGPVLVHCTAGKDRTGIVIALVQAAIGVPLQAIVEEYARSDAPTRLRRDAMIADPLPGDPPVATSPGLIWTAPSGAMEHFARRAIERWGSLEQWPVGLGVSPSSVVRLQEHLLET